MANNIHPISQSTVTGSFNRSSSDQWDETIDERMQVIRESVESFNDPDWLERALVSFDSEDGQPSFGRFAVGLQSGPSEPVQDEVSDGRNSWSIASNTSTTEEITSLERHQPKVLDVPHLTLKWYQRQQKNIAEGRKAGANEQVRKRAKKAEDTLNRLRQPVQEWLKKREEERTEVAKGNFSARTEEKVQVAAAQLKRKRTKPNQNKKEKQDREPKRSYKRLNCELERQRKEVQNMSRMVDDDVMVAAQALLELSTQNPDGSEGFSQAASGIPLSVSSALGPPPETSSLISPRFLDSPSNWLNSPFFEAEDE